MFEKLLQNKSVILVGNSIPAKPVGMLIDSFDVVIRINMGYANLNKEWLGKRTDMLSIGVSKRRQIPEKDLKDIHNIIWIDSAFFGLDTFTPYQSQKNVYFNTREDWHDLYKILGSKPSSGIMTFHLLQKWNLHRELKLINFDGFKTPSRYHIESKKNDFVSHHPHNGNKELEYCKNFLMTNI